MKSKRLRRCLATLEGGKRCEEKFAPWSSTQVACSQRCAWRIVEAKKASKANHELAEGREKLKSLTDHLNDTQAACNAFIRYRDREDGCISCGTNNPNIQYAAGHYRTVKAASQLRFNEDNIHKQCNKNCNSAKGGNVVEYRIRLVKKIGVARVEALESNNDVIRYTIEDAKRIAAHFKQKLKILKSKEI